MKFKHIKSTIRLNDDKGNFYVVEMHQSGQVWIQKNGGKLIPAHWSGQKNTSNAIYLVEKYIQLMN
jgi:hypothetical protein